MLVNLDENFTFAFTQIYTVSTKSLISLYGAKQM